MAENSGISWCDHTFNPWMGCTKVSPACKFCYAERDMDHRHGKVAWGPNGTRVLTSDQNWQKPVVWNRKFAEGFIDAFCADASKPRRPRVFCASLADVFEDWKGPITQSGVFLNRDYRALSLGQEPLTLNDVRQRLFALIDATPNLDWLLLTKRPENILKMWPEMASTKGRTIEAAYRSNVWLGTSVESQQYADERIPELLKCRDLSPVLFLSCEPLVGPVDLRPALWLEDQYFHLRPQMKRAIDWIITGGESGPEARPNHPEWFRDLRDQAGAARVPFHFKQWGEWAPGTVAEKVPHAAMLINGKYCTPDGREARMALDREVGGQWNHLQPTVMARVGKKAAGRLLDGVEHDGFPKAKI